MKYLRTILFVIIVLFSKFSIAQSSCLEDNLGKVYGIDDSLLKIWRMDKFGCDQNRIRIIDSVFKDDILIGIPKKAFLLMFGTPDEITTEGALIYKSVKECSVSKTPVKGTISLGMTVVFQKEKLLFFRKLYLD